MKSRLGTGGLGQKDWGLSCSRERRKMFGNENDMEDREEWMGGLILTKYKPFERENFNSGKIRNYRDEGRF